MKKFGIRKTLTLLLCLSTMLFVFGCGSKDGDQADAGDEPAKTEKTTDEKIDDLIATMTLEEKVGQMFIVRCPSDGTDIQSVSEYKLGAYILFADDFSGYTTEEVQTHIQNYQDEAKIPMLIGVDEEGGTVCRISAYPEFREEKFQSPRELYAQGGMDLLKEDAQEKSTLLKSLGVNLNFAPVCDISTDPSDFMYDRSLGEDPQTGGEFAKALVQIGNNNGVGSILKHFPGYGNTADTHTGIAYDDRSADSFKESDFVPFEIGMTGGSCAILVAHNIVNAFDPDMPASLSSAVHSILRDDLGFNGVILTDDLSMEAITDFTGSSAAAVTAVNAGNDMLCCTDYTVQIPAVIEACNNGEIDEARINDSVHRILLWKMELGLLTL
ncbi:beta-N-acetylhexosaminidase [Clostridiales Family XIII bacterium PM5-7]